jgi:Holliday junction resolvasome RuvABC endonuclease subunit
VIVLGVDPSLCNTGIAAVDLRPTCDAVMETLVIVTEPSAKKRRVLTSDDDARRVAEIAAGLDAAIRKHRPVALIVEAPAGSKGARAARALGLAIATVVAVAKLRELPLVQVQPLDVKRAACGTKAASKDDVILAIERAFPDVTWPTGPDSLIEHAADALGAVLAARDSETLRMARRLGAA